MRNVKHLMVLATSLFMLCACDKGNGNTDDPNKGDKPQVEVAAPVDPKPNSTSFDRKIMLVDFTGTGCVNCPTMLQPLKKVLAKSAYSKKTVLAMAHTYRNDDPAYFVSTLQTVMGVKYYPSLVANLNKSSLMVADDASELNIQSLIDNEGSSAADAGVAANSKVDGNKLYVRVNVKAATPDAQEFRVAVWILEDGIYGKQAGDIPDESYNTHDNCVRAILGNTTGSNYFGVTTEPSRIAAGEIGDVTFSFDLKDDWIKDNLKYLVAVSSKGTGETYTVCNAGVAKIGESVAYNYSK